MNKRRQKKETRKVVDGVVRRAYGLFRKKVVSTYHGLSRFGKYNQW